MATSNYQKIKMLKLLEMLRTDADETHPLTTDEICRRLEEMEISCDRRTVTKDIELLNQYGYEVLNRMVGHKKGYFLADRSFSLSELKILIDAVQAASFITEKKSEELIAKIAGLGSSYRADLLKNSLVRFNTSKHTNEQVYYAVLNIETALLERKKVSFFYYDLDENGERVYRKNKRRYIVDPVSLVMHEDNYYLLAYSEKYHGRTTYRIDRMETVCAVGRCLGGHKLIGHYHRIAAKLLLSLRLGCWGYRLLALYTIGGWCAWGVGHCDCAMGQHGLSGIVCTTLPELGRSEIHHQYGGYAGGCYPWPHAALAAGLLGRHALHQAGIEIGLHLRQLKLFLLDGVAQIHVGLGPIVNLILSHDCNILMILHSFLRIRLSREATVVGRLSVTKAISLILISS